MTFRNNKHYDSWKSKLVVTNGNY